MTRRSGLLALALLSAACSRTYIIEPAMGGTVATASTTGLTMSAEPNAWNGHPTDLGDYLTPIWIGIVNQRREDVRVSYADFALTDESGFRYAAVSPYTGQAVAAPPQSVPPPPPAKSRAPDSPPPESPPPDSPPPDSPSSASPPPDSPPFALAPPDPAPLASPPFALAPPDPELLASPSAALAPPDPELLASPSAALAPPGSLRSGRVALASFELVRYGGRGGRGHVYVGPRPGARFYVHPHYHGYFHYYAPWPYFYYWPPYYGTYVYYWDYRYYPGAPSYDVMRLGLPEGVAKSGGSVSGFVYFQNAATRATSLKLTWSVHTADGKSVASLSVPFVAVED
jgi:hypothetical protein